MGIAIIRDLFSGREMARMMSFVMMVFTLVPAIAPLLGAYIIGVVGWRGLFLAFILFAVVVCGWLMVRQEETLPAEKRRPFRAGPLWAALKEVLSYPVVRMSVLIQSLSFASLFAMLSSVQQIYDITYDRADSFPAWFAIVSLLAGTSSLLNAFVVVRFGIRAVVTTTLAVQILVSGAMIVTLSGGLWGEVAKLSD